jgi:hypothetical protein
MNYKIRFFDKEKGSIVVEFDGVGTFNIDLPIEDSKYPEGEALHNLIQQYAPVWVIEREEKISAGVTNESYIAGLVEVPTGQEQVPSTEQSVSPNQQMWLDYEMEKKVGDILVKFGLAETNPAQIPVTQL